MVELQIGENLLVIYVLRFIYNFLSTGEFFYATQRWTRRKRTTFVDKGPFIYTDEDLLSSRVFPPEYLFEQSSGRAFQIGACCSAWSYDQETASTKSILSIN